LGYKEIIAVIVSLILGGILALTTSPSISASAEATKGQMVFNEIEAIAAAANLYAINKNQTGSLEGLTAITLSPYIPSMKLNPSNLPYGRLVSKMHKNLEYHVMHEGNRIKISADATPIYYSRQTIKDACIRKYGSSNWLDEGNAFTVFIVR
jgi:hypothetical protein